MPEISSPEFIINRTMFFFICITSYSLHSLLIAPVLQIFTHFIQPMHALPLTKRTCLCHGRFIRPITLLVQTLRQFQHASHFFVSSKTYAVFVCSCLKNLCLIFWFLGQNSSKAGNVTITIVKK